MNKKNERIIGLVVGFIGLIILWWFRFDRWELVNTYKVLFTPMGELLHGITKNMMSDVISAESNRAKSFWYITQVVYIGAVWYYRACIGHWAIKSVKVFYEKL